MLELRPFQKLALQALSGSAHVICVAPTGSGKSLIYERLASSPGVRTLLVSPLVALARQQRERLARAGVSLGPRTGSGAWITSPETLERDAIRSWLKRWKPSLLVVDECHCLWDWGDGFRPAFQPLPDLIREHSIPRSLWLTATLPREARAGLLRQLPSGATEIGRFGLPQRLRLEFARVPWAERAEALLSWVRQQSAPGIVFVSTRESTIRLSRLLVAAGIPSLPYHAGLGLEERRNVETLLAENSPRAVVATSAFGMGLDYPQLEWVALWQAPLSILALAQAAGRVGRGDRPGRALVLWDNDDFRLLEWAAASSPRRREELRQLHALLGAWRCRRAALEAYFEGNGARGEGPCGACDFCDAGARGEPGLAV